MSNDNDTLSRWKDPAIWSLSSMLAVVFVVVGAAKVLLVDTMAANFARWNYPTWAMVAIGVLEIANGALLLTRRYAFFGACTLGVLMVGAYATHVTHGELRFAFVPVIMFGLICIVALARIPDDLRAWWHQRPHRGVWRTDGT